MTLIWTVPELLRLHGKGQIFHIESEDMVLGMVKSSPSLKGITHLSAFNHKGNKLLSQLRGAGSWYLTILKERF